MKKSRKEQIISLLEVAYWEFHFTNDEKVTKTLDFTCSYCNKLCTIILHTTISCHKLQENILWYLKDRALVSLKEAHYFCTKYELNKDLNLIRYCKACSITNRILPLKV